MTWLLIAQSSDPISGGAGWVGAGLLGLVLAWIFFFHLPAKDKQLKEILDQQAAERERDRALRHELGATLQASVGQVHEMYREDFDRFVQQTDKRLSDQAAEFKSALGTVLNHCQQEAKSIMDAFRSEIARVLGK